MVNFIRHSNMLLCDWQVFLGASNCYGGSAAAFAPKIGSKIDSKSKFQFRCEIEN